MAHLTKDHVQELYDNFGELRVLDDIVHHRAADDPPAPIFGYPKSEDSVNEYETFTGKQLDQFVDGAVKYFLESGLKPVRQSNAPLQKPSERGLTAMARMQKRSLAFSPPLMSILSSPFLPSAVWAILFSYSPFGYRLWRSLTFWSKPTAT